MKLTFLLLITALLQVSAGTYAQEITLSEKNARLEKVLHEIRKQSGYRILYNTQMLEDARRVDVHLTGVSLEEAMEDVFKRQPLTYTIANRTIVVKRRSRDDLDAPVFPAQDMEVKGIVTDTTGAPLPGATVSVKGKGRATSTDLNGAFVIEADAGDVLLVSYVGYLDQEVPVRGRATVHIRLIADVAGLDEVVVVGYGTQQRTDITGAVASVSEEALQSRPVTSFEDALQGRTGGVQVRQTGGNLDGRFSISIRGVGSVTGSNDPLIVVDGVPLFSGGFSTINPKDIVSIDILKDASATAIYGSRAANGVVIVSTRRGEAGQAKLTFSTDLGIDEISKRYEVLSTQQQRELFLEAFRNTNRNTTAYEDPTAPVWQVNTDWQDLATRSALRQSYNLGISGGNEKSRYAISASYLNREGIMKNSDIKSYFFRANNDMSVGNRLKISSNLTGSHQIQHVLNGDSFHGGAYRSLISTHTYTLPYDETGNLTAVNTTADPYFGENSNPLIDLLLPTREAKMTRLLGNIKADLEIASGLTLSGNIGGDFVFGNNYTYLPVFHIGRFARDQGTVTNSSDQEINWVADVTLEYQKAFGRHDLKILGGLSAQQFHTIFSSATGLGTINNDLDQLSNQTDYSASGSDVSAGLASSFMRVNYGYDNRYLATATIRRDGSSKFGAANQYGIFPSVSLAWRVSQEQFLESSTLFDDLKLRISYGLTGNQNIGNFAFITRAGAAPYVFGNSLVPGNVPQNIGNPNLQWESAKQFDIGLDVSLWQGRISFSADYYDKRSEDLLIRTPVPFTAGVGENPTVNIGSVKNTGIEFIASSRNLVGKFTWTTDLNLTHNKNEVLNIGTNSIGNPLEIPGNNIPLANEIANLTVSGRPVGAFYMYDFAGIWQLGEEEEAAAWSGAVPGDPRYADLNNNGVLDEGDKTFVGNPYPKFFGGINNTFSYRNFSFSVFANFSVGNELYHSMRNLNARSVPYNQQLAEIADFWTPENPTNKIPRPSQGGNTTFLATRVSTRFLESADFLRIKNMSLSYDLPRSILDQWNMQALRFTLAGTNLVTFTKYTGLDPESSSLSSLLSAGIDHTPYPLTRFYSLSVQLTF